MNKTLMGNLEKKLGLEPFDERMTVAYLKGKLSKKEVAVKTCLLNQHIFVGLGNIYVDEVLFLCKLNPEKKICTTRKYRFYSFGDAMLIL